MEKITKEISNQNDEYQNRKKKIDDLSISLVSPWPDNFKILKYNIEEIKTHNFDDEINKDIYYLSGRVKSIREHGKSIFITLSDSSGIIQAYAKNEDQVYNFFIFIKKYIDVGDIIEIGGTLFLTKMGEKTIRLNHCILLSKCKMLTCGLRSISCVLFLSILNFSNILIVCLSLVL